jgi:membrane protease YdiL (CAAX protease family)
MCPNGSVPERPFPPGLALAVTGLGVAAMVGVSLALAARPGLASLRGQIALGTLLLALPALAALAAWPALWPGVRGRRDVSGRVLGLSLLLGAALWVASAGLMEVQALVVPPDPAYLEAFRAIHRALAPRSALDALVSLLVIALLPGVCEEVVVRGVLLPSLAAWLPRPAWLAVLLSALVFAAIHLDPYRFVFTLALGLVFGFLRLHGGSLWPPVVAHASLNSLTFALAPLVDDPSRPYAPSPALGAACLVAGSAAAWPLWRALSALLRSRALVDSPLHRP